VGPFQFKWVVTEGNVSRVMQSWSGSNTFYWTPTHMSANYTVRVQVRSSTNRADAPDNPNADRAVPFEIGSDTATAISMTSDKDGPQPKGTSVQFTVRAYGGQAAYQYQWLVFNGSTWGVMLDWSSGNSFTWTPATANAKYQVMVKVRGGTNLATNAALSMPFPIE